MHSPTVRICISNFIRDYSISFSIIISTLNPVGQVRIFFKNNLSALVVDTEGILGVWRTPFNNLKR